MLLVDVLLLIENKQKNPPRNNLGCLLQEETEDFLKGVICRFLKLEVSLFIFIFNMFY